ncbi:hypothetical protein E4J89_01250 [Arthrobacter sp. CAU 1506]|uniref:hypothetical protein n=1 Tax=Arthrobacter sp. CAU 1506 TaxID=2560052 RepID=UPI0010ABF451|nr:hypothetical protein [Arthrobacter sp. CAU 1506]TJY72349.1 hypothetical protein E4J89_01250 [Arthrobacter sp. CAU 1506]
MPERSDETEAGMPESGNAERGRRKQRWIAAALVGVAGAAVAVAAAWSAWTGAGTTTAPPSDGAVASAAAGQEAASGKTGQTGETVTPSEDDAEKSDKKSEEEKTDQAKTKPSEAAKESGDGSVDNSPSGSLAVAKDADRAATPKPVAPAVELEETADVAGGVATISKIEAIEAKAEGIGQIAGPAIRFVVEVRNTSDQELKLDTAEITVEAGAQKLPAIRLDGSGTKLFPLEVAAGKRASGTFVFLVPEDQRGQVRIYLNYAASESVVAFEGAAPRKAG